MTKYPNSACEEHRSVKTSEPVCIICMAEEINRLKALALASLKARDAEARAAMTLENAEKNFHRHDQEARAYERAMLAASAADKALRDAVAPNAIYRAKDAL